jgi:putative membrane protein
MKRFSVRIIVNVIALYLAALLIHGVDYHHNWWVLTITGIILALVNIIIKPILVVLALPAIVVTLGLFMIIINGFIVWLTHIVYHRFEISSFGAAVLVGLIVSLLNYILTRAGEAHHESNRS